MTDLLELAQREVHGHHEGLEAGLAPRLVLAAGLFEDPAADRDDQPRLLGERDEVQRRHEPAGRVHPAQERLDARDASALELHDGLEVQDELVVVEGTLQVGGERVVRFERTVHLMQDLRRVLQIELDHLPQHAAGLRIERRAPDGVGLAGVGLEVGEQGMDLAARGLPGRGEAPQLGDRQRRTAARRDRGEPARGERLGRRGPDPQAVQAQGPGTCHPYQQANEPHHDRGLGHE